MASDGNLSKDGRHLAYVSKDLQLIGIFKKCLDIEYKVSLKKADLLKEARVIFYNLVMSIFIIF